MEETEPMVAQMLTRNKVRESRVESNNGGRGFARVIDSLTDNSCNVSWFHQSKNKDARILTHSNWCQKNILFPENWSKRWPDFFRALTKYTKEGKNKHDDAPDTLTGVAERFAPSGGMPIFNANANTKRESYQWQN